MLEICPAFIPWEFVKNFEDEIVYQFEKTLEDIAENGGLTVSDILTAIDYRNAHLKAEIDQIGRLWCYMYNAGFVVFGQRYSGNSGEGQTFMVKPNGETVLEHRVATDFPKKTPEDITDAAPQEKERRLQELSPKDPPKEEKTKKAVKNMALPQYCEKCKNVFTFLYGKEELKDPAFEVPRYCGKCRKK